MKTTAGGSLECGNDTILSLSGAGAVSIPGRASGTWNSHLVAPQPTGTPRLLKGSLSGIGKITWKIFFLCLSLSNRTDMTVTTRRLVHDYCCCCCCCCCCYSHHGTDTVVNDDDDDNASSDKDTTITSTTTTTI